MDSLPPEVLQLISSNLNRDDVPSFRSVSRLVSQIAIRHLTVKGYFCFRKHSLERLRRISQHPVLSKNLHEIIFFVDILPEFQERANWEDQARAMCHTAPGNDHLAIEWLQRYPLNAIVSIKEVREEKSKVAGWRVHRRIQQEQKELLLRDACTFMSMKSSLVMMSNLKAFSVETFQSFHQDLMRKLYTLDATQAWYCSNSICALGSF